MNVFIVSRHPATIAYIQEKFEKLNVKLVVFPQVTEKEIIAIAKVAKKSQVKIIGNLPLKIISEILELPGRVEYYAVEFSDFPPRGVELSPKDLESFGISITRYTVESDLSNFLNF